MALFDKRNWKDIASGILLLASVVCVLLALNLSPYPADSEVAAQKVQKVLAGRMASLDAYAQKALQGDLSKWMDLEGIPEDMVVYRYVNDSLQSWANRFTVQNDDISNKVMFQQFTSQRTSLSSPLLSVTPVAQYMNLGPAWYLIYSREEGDCKVIAGLEIMNENASVQGNGVNKHLGLGSQFSIEPLSNSGGSAVYLGEVPLFKIIFDSFSTYTLSNSYMIWVALLLLILGAFLYLSAEKCMQRYHIVQLVFLGASLGMYLFGLRLQNENILFSPTLYADGPMLYSLAAVVIINLYVVLLVTSTYMIRGLLYRKFREIQPSREQAKAYWNAMTPEKWEAQIRRIFGKTAPEIIEMERKGKKNDPAAHEERLNRILAHWDGIMAAVNEELPDEAKLRTLLENTGMPVKPSQIHISVDDTVNAFVGSRDARLKYMSCSVLWDLGLTDEFADYLRRVAEE